MSTPPSTPPSSPPSRPAVLPASNMDAYRETSPLLPAHGPPLTTSNMAFLNSVQHLTDILRPNGHGEYEVNPPAADGNIPLGHFFIASNFRTLRVNASPNETLDWELERGSYLRIRRFETRRRATVAWFFSVMPASAPEYSIKLSDYQVVEASAALQAYVLTFHSTVRHTVQAPTYLGLCRQGLWRADPFLQDLLQYLRPRNVIG